MGLALVLISILTFAIMASTFIYVDHRHELRLPSCVMLFFVALIPIMNVIVAIICVVAAAAIVLDENKGIVVYRWRK